ncbi:CYTH domain-containing protein [candidate division KSB1 bacterium]|nr:CYTH domain-containing protein [candidate division KSB1 bacterium]
MKNLELKVKLRSFDDIHINLQKLKAEYQWTRHQIDHYFQVPQGRLKIRLQDHSPAELVSYLRPDQPDMKLSNYSIFPHENPELLIQTLSLCLPLSVKIEKMRSLYLWKNVRIHLDDVKHLGFFLEFEAVESPEYILQENENHLTFLIDRLNLNHKDFVQVGYHDLLMNQNNH